MMLSFRRSSWLPSIALLGVLLSALLLRSGYLRVSPFLPDGDTYFHGMMIEHIVDHHFVTPFVPYEVPDIQHGYPYNFHILGAELEYLTGASTLQVVRWFGPILSMIITLAVYVAARRLTKSSWAALLASFLSLFPSIYSSRLAATFPENVIVLFVPVVLWLLFYNHERRSMWNMVVLTAIALSAVGYHFSSYLLLPTVGTGILLHFVGRHWRWKNIGFLGIWGALFLGLVSVCYSTWWILGFLGSFFKSYSGAAITTTGESARYTLPAPTTAQWLEQLGLPLVLLAAVGLVVFLWRRKYSWRNRVGLASIILIILLPLQILPWLHLFSYTPFRAFTYLTPVMVLLVAVVLTEVLKKKTIWTTLPILLLGLLFFVPNSSIRAAPGAGEQNLTAGEYQGVTWLVRHTSDRTLVATAPANGRQVAFFTKHPVAYDTSSPVFDAKTSADAVDALQTLGNYQTYYIYVSKYKLGPVYNFGWIRDYAFVSANLKKFKTKPFKIAFEDDSSLIFSYAPSVER